MMMEDFIQKLWLSSARQELLKACPALEEAIRTASYEKQVDPEAHQKERTLLETSSGIGRENVQAAYDRFLMVTAMESAVLNYYDFKCSVNIAMARSNVERTTLNAENLLHYYEKDIMAPAAKLGERLQLICRLNWIGTWMYMLQEITGIRGAMTDRSTNEFVRSLGAFRLWKEAVSSYRAIEEKTPEHEQQKGFDAWLEETDRVLVCPLEKRWISAGVKERIITGFKRSVQACVGLAVLFAIGSYCIGRGPVAAYFHHLKPVLTTPDHISGFGSYAPVDIADYNASSIREDPDGNDRWSDRHLMDGDITTTWSEGESDAGINRRLYFNPEKTRTIHYIVIYNGDQSSEEAFYEHNRLKRVTIRINDRQKDYGIRLADTMGPQYIRVEDDVDRFWIIIESVYRGTDDENVTSVSEVELY